MAATADDIIAAMDRLTRAIQDAAIRPEKAKEQKAAGPRATDDDATGDVYEAAYAAGDLRSGNIGRTIRGMRSAWKLWDKYGKGGGQAAGEGEAAAGAEAGEGAAAAGGAAEGGAAAGEAGAVAAGGGAAAAGGPVGIAVAAVVLVLAGLVLAFRAFKHHVEETTDELINTQAKLAEASGAMASVFAEREMREIQRDIDKGGRLSNSARYLARGEQERKDKEASFEVLGTKIQNYVEGLGNRFLAGLYSKPSEWADRVDKWLDKLTGDEPVEDVGTWLGRVEDREAGRLEAAKKRMQAAAAAIDRGKVVPPGR